MTRIFLTLFISLGFLLPSLLAHIAEWDEVWRRREQEAWNSTLKAYEPYPEKINSELNMHTNRVLNEFKNDEDEYTLKSNSTRRELRGKRWRGPCLATNPIDKCWRCQRNWALNRKRLADCGLGFGRKAIGGKNGPIYVVRDNSDDIMNPKPGTLRHAVIQKGPLWIIFKRSMVIRLVEELIMTSDKTIDARGARVYIANGAGITLQFVNNVIIHGLRIHNIYAGNGGLIRDSVDHFGLRTASDGDGISIFGSTNIWIDHVSMWRCYDGIIDVIEGSTGITISNSHFTDHNEVMLFGASDSYTKDMKMQITVAFNHFGKRLIQRMPRCRFGYIHVVNNDYTHWNMYAIGGSQNPTIISQGNRFIAPPDIFKKEVTKREYTDESVWKSWNWRSEGDLLMNGAFFVQSGDPQYTLKHPQYYDGIIPASGSHVKSFTRCSGALNCVARRPC